MPQTTGKPGFVTSAGLALLAAASLLFEIALTRLLALTQFYHFASMIISLAMLGTSLSGTILALRPQLGRRFPHTMLACLTLGTGLTTLGSYLLLNLLPFDSFSIAWDRRQIGILTLHYIALATPFLLGGLATGWLLTQHPQHVGRLYAANLMGAAGGALLAVFLPPMLGGPGAILAAAFLTTAAAFILAAPAPPRRRRLLRLLTSLLGLGYLALLEEPPAWLQPHLSPYKALSHTLRLPGTHLLTRQWSATSRLDVVASPAIRSLPGLSYRYIAVPPPQRGLFVNGDAMTPILQLPLQAAAAQLHFTDYMPTAIAYRLRPNSHTLILAPKGGLELWVAMAQGAGTITAVEPEPHLIQLADGIYRHPQVRKVTASPRSFLRRTRSTYALIVLPLTTPYRPIRSGAYSLTENYLLTREAVEAYLTTLEPDGLLVLTRWLQLPPSESLRAFALLVEALEQLALPPERCLVAFRGYTTMTLLAKRSPFTPEELNAIRRFTDERAFDLAYIPDLRTAELNRHNILPVPAYHDTFTALLHANDRRAWYATYPFDVTPPTDDHPFFDHYFKWRQAPQVLGELGKQWLPFGGAGYFVLLVLLTLAATAAAAILLLPWLFRPTIRHARAWRTASHFALIGAGYMLVEIPLIQRFTLYLDHPTYATATIIAALLLTSGAGSLLFHHLPRRLALTLLTLCILGYTLGLPFLLHVTSAWSLGARVAATPFILLPLGLLMGQPFPSGLRDLSLHPDHRPWAWGVNGAASVVASILAALFTLTWGITPTLGIAALCYGLATLTAPR